MDAHFSEYVAAIEGMREVYGEREDGFPTEYHDDTVPAVEPVAVVGGTSHWDA